jgi:geranylgeranyl diphosphate synthase type I
MKALDRAIDLARATASPNGHPPEAQDLLPYHRVVLGRVDMADLVAEIEAEILRLAGDREASTRPLYEMVRYHLGLDGGPQDAGKRLRPLLGLLAYASLTGDYRRALPGAAAVELGHNFSLVHDDIEDGDVERRHRPTLWTIYGIPQAINAGDTLFVLSRLALHRASELGFSDAKVLSLMRLYDETCLALCEGQFLDIWASEHAEELSVELYLEMVGKKTASLIAASVQGGAMLATDDETVVQAYRAFGWALGIAFQVNDDVLGIWGAEQATGKEPSDLAKHKKTLPVIYALQHGLPADRERLLELYGAPELTPEGQAEARTILERAGAREYARGQAQRYRDEAVAALDDLEARPELRIDGEARARLRDIVISAISA